MKSLYESIIIGRLLINEDSTGLINGKIDQGIKTNCTI